MKRFILLFLAGLSLSSYAQVDSTLATLGKLNFAIPVHPAFSILDNNPDNILRPGNTQEIVSLIYSNFLSGKTLIIPKDFSIEFSPAQLIGIRMITFENYAKNGNRILYDAKISIGARTSDDGKNLKNIAAGLRFTWVDKTSLAANKEFVNEAWNRLMKDAGAEHEFILELEREGKQYQGRLITEDEVAGSDSVKAFIHNLYYARQFGMKAFRELYKNKYWNKFKFETALAVRYSSADSLMTHSHYSKFEIYNTLAFPLGKSGQILVGLNYSDNLLDTIHLVKIDSLTTIKDTLKYHASEFTLATRLYAGTNKFKGFIEGSGKWRSDNMLKFGLNIGAEICVTDGLWAILTCGNSWNKSTVSSAGSKWSENWFWNIDLRFKIPEKMKL